MMDVFSWLVMAGMVVVFVAHVKGRRKPRDTKVREPWFRLRLPGAWSRVPSAEDEGRWVFRNEAEPAQVAVSVFPFSEPPGPDERRRELERITLIRRRVEVSAATPSAVRLQETIYGETGGVLAARYGGIQPDAQRRFYGLLLCSSVAVTTFYIEVYGLTEEQAKSRAKGVFNTIRVA